MCHLNGVCAYVWTYKVKPSERSTFIDAYGPNGVWNKFFSKSSGYIRTDLLSDEEDPNRFCTIDYFKDKNARADLVAANKKEFDEIDQHWEAATIEEQFIGLFGVKSEA